MLDELGTAGVATSLGTTERTVRKRKAKLGLSAHGTQGPPKFDGGVTYTIDKRPPVGGWTPEALLEAHGLNPEEWWVSDVRAVGNQWGNPEEPNEQVKLAVTAKPVRAGVKIQPPDLSDWKPLRKPRRRKQKGPIKAMVIADHHAPRHEKVFHELTVQRLKDRQPDIIDVNGDLLDLPSVSSHRTIEAYKHSVNECTKAGMRILRDYRNACPDARIVLKRGNHCNRVEYYQEDRAPELSGLLKGGGEKPDGSEWDVEQNDLRELLWLDELHVEFIPEEWKQAKHKLNKRLTTRHGFSTSPIAGKVILDKLSGSTFQGHDHRLWMTLRTRHTGDPDNPLEVRMAMGGGCACEIPGGLGYVNGSEPDWQNAFIEATLYDDDDFYACPAIYVPGRLLCSDGRYVA